MKKFLLALIFVGLTIFGLPDQASACGTSNGNCYTPCVSYCYSYCPPYPCYQNCRVFWYCPSTCCWYMEPYCYTYWQAQQRVAQLRCWGYCAYYRCYYL